MTQYFGNSLGSSAGQIFHRMKPQPLLNIINTIGIDEIPTVRTGIYNLFRIPSATSIQLRNTSTNTVVATLTTTDYLSGSVHTNYYLSSTDQCLYILIRNTTNLQLLKMDDSSGSVTAIGTPITPANISNWPAALSYVNFGFMDNPSNNILRIINNGFIHQIDKTTGSLVTEDVAISLGGYSLLSGDYLNSDQTILTLNSGLGLSFSLAGWNGDMVSLPRCTSIKTGSGRANSGRVPNTGFMSPPPFSSNTFIAIDDKYLCFMDSSTRPGNTASTTPLKLVLRTDFERLLEDSNNFYAGLL